MACLAADSPLAPHDVIFSCSICQATISEIYATLQGDQGFKSNSDGSEKEHVVTKLWLTECSHLTCSLHLEGGGEDDVFSFSSFNTLIHVLRYTIAVSHNIAIDSRADRLLTFDACCARRCPIPSRGQEAVCTMPALRCGER
jgi:hypothetical protein